MYVLVNKVYLSRLNIVIFVFVDKLSGELLFILDKFFIKCSYGYMVEGELFFKIGCLIFRND